MNMEFSAAENPRTASMLTLAPGTRLHGGQYRIDAVLGQGGYAVTYAATDLHLEREVAVKEFFPLGCARSSGGVEPTGPWTVQTYQRGLRRFMQEAQALARFDDPGVVRVHTVFREMGTAFIVMERLRGVTLHEKRQGAVLPESDVIAYARHIGRALSVVHAAGMLHRDLKPTNIMVSGDRVVLIDFGTAHDWLAETTHSITLTPGYAPIEQYSGRAPLGPYTDVYALAATLYEMLTGTPPTAATDRVAEVPNPSARRRNPRVSERTSAALERALEMRSGDRPQSAAAFVEMLTAPSAATAGSSADLNHTDFINFLRTRSAACTQPASRATVSQPDNAAPPRPRPQFQKPPAVVAPEVSQLEALEDQPPLVVAPTHQGDFVSIWVLATIAAALLAVPMVGPVSDYVHVRPNYILFDLLCLPLVAAAQWLIARGGAAGVLQPRYIILTCMGGLNAVVCQSAWRPAQIPQDAVVYLLACAYAGVVMGVCQSAAMTSSNQWRVWMTTTLTTSMALGSYWIAVLNMHPQRTPLLECGAFVLGAFIQGVGMCALRASQAHHRNR